MLEGKKKKKGVRVLKTCNPKPRLRLSGITSVNNLVFNQSILI